MPRILKAAVIYVFKFLILFPLKDFSFASQVCMGNILTVKESKTQRRTGGEPAGMKEQQPCADQMPCLLLRHVLKGWSQNIQNIQSVLITTPLACIGHWMVLKAVFGVEAGAS